MNVESGPESVLSWLSVSVHFVFVLQPGPVIPKWHRETTLLVVTVASGFGRTSLSCGQVWLTGGGQGYDGDKSPSLCIASSESQIPWSRSRITTSIFIYSLVYSFRFRKHPCFLGFGFYLHLKSVILFACLFATNLHINSCFLLQTFSFHLTQQASTYCVLRHCIE